MKIHVKKWMQGMQWYCNHLTTKMTVELNLFDISRLFCDKTGTQISVFKVCVLFFSNLSCHVLLIANQLLLGALFKVFRLISISKLISALHASTWTNEFNIFVHRSPFATHSGTKKVVAICVKAILLSWKKNVNNDSHWLYSFVLPFDPFVRLQRIFMSIDVIQKLTWVFHMKIFFSQIGSQKTSLIWLTWRYISF